MSRYNIFGKFYDSLMTDVNYHKMAKKYDQIFKKSASDIKLIADIGCGTGSLSIELAKMGYDVIAVDSSTQMLEMAKAKENTNDILFINQKIENLDLYGTIDGCVASLDVINHIVSPKILQRCFDKVSLFMNKGGIFAFDINTPKKFYEVYADNCFVFENENVFCTWQNDFNKKTRKCSFYLTFFEEIDDEITRYDEEIIERMYEISEIKDMLFKAGFYKIKVSFTEKSCRAIVEAVKK
ncbi:MAG: methyltransferase domain-containing protein [Clostridia bacterium]